MQAPDRFTEPDIESRFSSRRAFLASSIAFGTAALSGCAWRAPLEFPSRVRRDLSKVPFARPRIDASQVKDIRVGFRPFRPGGFVARGEAMGGKWIVHNYGHGGGGITLSWGSSVLALREMPDLADKRAIVIGCGVMGLTTARQLQERGFQVTILTREPFEQTTSHVAGGHWAPTGVSARRDETAAFDGVLDAALSLSHAHFSGLAGRMDGVYWRENYQLADEPFADGQPFYATRWPRFFPGRRVLATDEHPFPHRHVLTYQSLFIEPAIYLKALWDAFSAAGGRMRQHEARSIEELMALDVPLIANCTGLGARDLFGDTELVPVRGQILLLEPDERIDFNTHGGGEGLLYMFPRRDGILLGGSFERGATQREADVALSGRILGEHARMFAGMRSVS
jgi:glycine/D-amino acid oxidase-like deaminating enzyme